MSEAQRWLTYVELGALLRRTPSAATHACAAARMGSAYVEHDR